MYNPLSLECPMTCFTVSGYGLTGKLSSITHVVTVTPGRATGRWVMFSAGVARLYSKVHRPHRRMVLRGLLLLASLGLNALGYLMYIEMDKYVDLEQLTEEMMESRKRQQNSELDWDQVPASWRQKKDQLMRCLLLLTACCHSSSLKELRQLKRTTVNMQGNPHSLGAQETRIFPSLRSRGNLVRPHIPVLRLSTHEACH